MNKNWEVRGQHEFKVSQPWWRRLGKKADLSRVSFFPTLILIALSKVQKVLEVLPTALSLFSFTFLILKNVVKVWVNQSAEDVEGGYMSITSTSLLDFFNNMLDLN